MKNNLTLVLLLSMFSVLVIGTSLITSINAQENVTEYVPKFFAIQHAQSGSLLEINETAYSLELNDVSDKTILFSDRPDRIVTSMSTSDFIGNWSTGKDSFSVDAPNAVLVVDESEKQDITIVELSNPFYDSNKKSLKYDISLDDTTFINIISEFGQNTMMIDSSNICGLPPCY